MNDLKPPKNEPVVKAGPTEKKSLTPMDELKNQIRQIKEAYRDLEAGSPKNVSLRWMMKQDGIAIHPNKAKLQEAIQKHQKRLRAVATVQRIFRGHLARLFWRKYKRGNRISDCVNETDFYTLEPLSEIDKHLLYFYKSGEHTYGFHLQSLLIYYGKCRSIHDDQLLNPYNREVMNRRNIQQLLHLTHLFFPQVVMELKLQDKPYYRVFMGGIPVGRSVAPPPPPQNVVRIIRPTPPVATANTATINISDLIYNRITATATAVRSIVYNPPIIAGEIQAGIAEHLAEIERLPLTRRIHELFIDFDLLGNYTDARWFLNQNLRGYKVYFIKLNELWNHLPPFVQQSICCVGDPFYLVDVRNIHQQDLESMRGACLKVMEYITHGGVSREDQKLGIYQLLIALTFISREARHSMNHLL